MPSYYPLEDLSKLSKKEIDERMSKLSSATTAYHPKMVHAEKDYVEQIAMQGAYEALTAEYDRLKAEYDKKIS